MATKERAPPPASGPVAQANPLHLRCRPALQHLDVELSDPFEHPTGGRKLVPDGKAFHSAVRAFLDEGAADAPDLTITHLHAPEMHHDFPSPPQPSTAFPQCETTLNGIAGWLRATLHTPLPASPAVSEGTRTAQNVN